MGTKGVLWQAFGVARYVAAQHRGVQKCHIILPGILLLVASGGGGAKHNVHAVPSASHTAEGANCVLGHRWDEDLLRIAYHVFYA